MRKLLILGLLLTSFNALGKTFETPTFLIQCQDCTIGQLRDWFFNTIVLNTSKKLGKRTQRIYSEYRIIVHRPESSRYDAFKVIAPVTRLMQGDIKPETTTSHRPLIQTVRPTSRSSYLPMQSKSINN